MFPILFQVGPFTLHTYGLLVAVGFLVALFVARKSFLRHGLPLYWLDQMVLALMAGGFFGARLLYFAVNGFRDLAADPWSFFRVWEGGLVFYGGFAAGFVVVALYSWRKEVSFLTLVDALSPPLLLAHAIGRLGCFAAGCCYGKPTDSAWSVTFTHPESLAPRSLPLHPTQVYEAAGNFLLFLALWNFGKVPPRPGVIFGLYLLSYGAFRFLMEFLRGDDRGVVLAGFFPSQWISGLAVAGGIGVLLYAHYAQRRG